MRLEVRSSCGTDPAALRIYSSLLLGLLAQGSKGNLSVYGSSASHPFAVVLAVLIKRGSSVWSLLQCSRFQSSARRPGGLGGEVRVHDGLELSIGEFGISASQLKSQINAFHSPFFFMMIPSS